MIDMPINPLAGFSTDDLQEEIDRRFEEVASNEFSIARELKRVMGVPDGEKTDMEHAVMDHVIADGPDLYRVDRPGVEFLTSIYEDRQAAKRNS